MSSARLAGSGHHARTRPVDDVVVSLLSALLPAGFRERQRGEWTSDLLMLADGAPSAFLSLLRAAHPPTIVASERFGR